MTTEIVLSYLRKDKLPHIWCPGCGHGIILGSLLRAIHKTGWNKDDITLVSGIGCSSRTPGYVDFNTLHTTHGRSLAFACGIKFSNPKMNVISVMGDGDAVAIGGNHFIHASRRNLNITALIFNNYIYGMTGGQFSPTTPGKAIASTTPYGNIDNNFDIAALAIGAGAGFVARSSAVHVPGLDDIIYQALNYEGFSVVEILSFCHVQYGKRNKLKTPYSMMDWLRKRMVPIKAYDALDEEAKKEKIPMGIFKNIPSEEYSDKYKKLIIEPNKSKNSILKDYCKAKLYDL
ncbi:2-oxoacid:ferredoxin oxidoreductase subunit beta [candidate division WOR-3 bacterium]|nr:2-oxoacid:ferredoxin oxidoreductase subunit beta [candidate division WOR-3 bacterium]